jgi:membrane dipeptidase
LIAITFFEFAVCGKDAPAIARAIRHAAEVTGIDHVALGSDFDGAVDAPFDTTGVGLLVDALLSPAGGFSEEDTAKIIGGNAFRVLGETLP